MEAATAATSSLVLSFSSPARRSPPAAFLRCSPTSSPRPPPPPPRTSCCYYSSPTTKQQQEQQRRLLPVSAPRYLSSRCSAAAAGSPSTVVSSERWLLEPAGDGDWRHIGYRVPRPGAIEIASSGALTVGRVPENADIVIPVATVSGVHARLEKKDGSLVVTDMDSTNGTYINERKLVPGFGVAVEPGSLLIFGDIHLAMFRVRKMVVDVPSETNGDDEQGAKTEVVSSVAEETG